MRVRLLGLVSLLASCGGGGAQPIDAGGGDSPAREAASEASADAAPEAGTDTGTGGGTDAPVETGTACVPLADRAISEAAGQSGRPALAWDGDGYGLVWPDDRGG